MNKATCNNCRWTDCPIRRWVNLPDHYCEDWEHYSQAVPTCGEEEECGEEETETLGV